MERGLGRGRCEELRLHGIFGTAGRTHASWERELHGFHWERELHGFQTTVKLSHGGERFLGYVERRTSVGWNGVLPSQLHSSFTGSPFIATSCSGLEASLALQ